MAKPLMFGPYPARIRLTRDEQGIWNACAVLRTAKGDITFHASADERAILAALVRRAQAQPATPPDGAASGDFFRDLSRKLKRAARKIAASKAVRGVMGVVNKVMKSPIFRAVASIIPGAGLTLASVDAARGLLSAVEKGSPKALRALEQIEGAARKGNPLAVQSLAAVRSTFEALDRVAPNRGADAVSGAEILPAAQAEHARLLPATAATQTWTHSGPPAALRWVWDELRPRQGYRTEEQAFTTREAYRGGLDVLAARRAA